jgi:molybdenum-dependent DNA-binding transcriptional regulator ModE
VSVSQNTTRWRQRKARVILIGDVETCYARTGSIKAVMDEMNLTYEQIWSLLTRMREANGGNGGNE